MNPTTKPSQNTEASPAHAEPKDRLSPATELALCVWFLLVIVAFWGPYLGFLHPEITTPLYGLFLLGGVAAAALRLLRQREAARQNPIPSTERKPRRGN